MLLFCCLCMLCSFVIIVARSSLSHFFFFFNDTATTEIYTLSLHDALPISLGEIKALQYIELSHNRVKQIQTLSARSEEHTSELQSPCNLVCRLLLEKKKKKKENTTKFSRQQRNIARKHRNRATQSA